MSLFGSSPTHSDREPTTPQRQTGGPGDELFGKPAPQETSSNDLFGEGGSGRDDEPSPWDLPTPRKQQKRADMIRNLLPPSDVPDSYIETFDTVVREDGSSGHVTAGGVAKLLAMARLGAEAQARIMSLLTQDDDGSSVSLGRSEFNVLLALIGLAQEGDVISLDGVDERRKDLPQPKLPGLTAEPILPPVAELAAKPAQMPTKPQLPPPMDESQPAILRPTMDDPMDDPWNTPELHKGHDHLKANGSGRHDVTNGHETTSSTEAARSSTNSASAQGGWGGFYQASNSPAAGGFNASPQNVAAAVPFGGDSNAGRAPGIDPPAATTRNIGGRTGSNLEENILVTLMPEKEGMFLFQHHNYEVASQRRGSKVIRRYSDFVWLLDCLQKRYPFRVLPLLPPKRVAVNGNHLSNDGAFIEKRRRGLARFLNALVRHPVLSQEQLVVMFLTVPTELAVWRKQATISVQDEFADKALPPGLEDSLPATLEELFSRTRSGVRRSAELYINICNILDRLVKRTEGVAADHARVAMMLGSLTETSSDTYATDTNEVPLLNDGLLAMSKHLRTCQTLLEDESRGWDEGVLEDLKRQRDALVSVRDMFDRRERLDKDNIPYLERRIQTNETKLTGLRSKPEGAVKAGEIERVAESIIKDKESIVRQHNQSVFVKECLRDELVTFQSTQYHISRWNQDWAGERVKYAEMLADNWRRLLDELEGMPLGD
ncbi:PX domain-containing protein [Hirsutella rhossiliensis]|uniref:Sorting nexin MVP1 n=1 Tax=Hirsutella rhossiliensis TaxID=111463 RepID=A0A9P8MU25_9HYPO|nr:PX domain-containing protein [Hirsutella rhossiliensis]KAH0961412.1 PX domain-containing protein [Hirsutella rhossiliensis]